MIIRLTLLLIFLVAPLGTSLAGEAWVLYFQEPKPVSPSLIPPGKYYYDRNSITQVEPNVYEVYLKESFKESVDDNDMTYGISQYWFDCTKRMVAIGNTTTYMAGEKIGSNNLFKHGFYKLREPYGNIIIDPQLLLMPIICNK